MKLLRLFLSVACLTGCGKQAKLDSAGLDSLLSNGQIDRILLTSPYRTNILTVAAPQKYVLALSKTNRVATPDATKAQVENSVGLCSGEIQLAWLSQFDNGVWKFGEYSFQLKIPPN